MTVIQLLERREYAEGFLKDHSMGTNKSDGLAIRKGFIPIEVKAEGDNLIRFIISDGSIDRDNDTINVDGWKLDNFKNNPVVLWAHDQRSAPIGKAVSIGVTDDKLIADTEFVGKDIMEFADMVFQLYKGGFMNAVSVGFMPDERVWSDEQGGIKFLTQELLEFSAVPVPANPNALQIARSSGIDIAPMKMWAEKLLDEWTDGNRSVGASRKALERMFKDAKEVTPTADVDPDKQKELRQRNIWEPRLKAFREDGTWDAVLFDSSDPTNDTTKVPAFILEEFTAAKLLADHVERDAYVAELMEADIPVVNAICELHCGGLEQKDFDLLVQDFGKETIELIREHDALSDQNTVIEQRVDLDALNALVEEMKDDVATMQDLETALNALADKNEETEAALETMTSDRDNLLLQLAQQVVEQSEQRVNPAKMVEMFGGALAKAVKGLTGKID